jgi:GNAT superfamily N-acetyltransferase
VGGGGGRRSPARARLRPGIPVRRALPTEARVVASLLHAFNTEFDTPTPPVEVLAERLAGLLDGDAVVALLAPEPAAAVALVTFRPNVWYAGPVALLDELYVRPDLRGGGIGAALLAGVCALARERGGELVEINVDEGDVDARRFYERHGFANTEPGWDERLLYYFRELS